MTEIQVAVLVPTRGRHQRLMAYAHNLAESTQVPVRLVWIVDDDDALSLDAALATSAVLPTVVLQEPVGGRYVTCLNAGFRRTSEPWVFLSADDVRYHPRWLEKALEVAAANNAWVIGTNDIGNPRTAAGTLSTHTLVYRRYVEECGAVLNQPGNVVSDAYMHSYNDDELVETAKYHGRWGHAKDSIVEHLHPSWGKAELDANQRRYLPHEKRDGELFKLRSVMWQKVVACK